MMQTRSLPRGAAGMLWVPRTLARVAVWLFVLALTLGTATMVAQEPAELVAFGGLSVLFLAWEVFAARLGVWGGALIGLVVFGGGTAWDWHLPTSLGLAIVALSLPRRWAGPGVAVLAAFTIWQWSNSGLYTSELVLRGAMVLAQNVLFVYLLERIQRSGVELERTREELGHLEVNTERARLASELNKVIGSTLDRAGAQADEIRDLVNSDHPKVHEQLVEISTLIERGREQLALLAYEPVIDDFEGELRTARTLCRQLEVEFIATIDEVDDRVSEVFALILREATTNMFKHSMPSRCTVIVRSEGEEAVFGFTNDGVRENQNPKSNGSGHRRWRAKLAELGGVLETSMLTGDRFQVRVRVPLDQRCEAHREPAGSVTAVSKEFSHG